MPQGKHSRRQFKLCDAVNQVAETLQIALDFPELRCTFGGRSIVPDVQDEEIAESAIESFRQGWHDAMKGNTLAVSQL